MVNLFGDPTKRIADLIEAEVHHRYMKEQLAKMDSVAERIQEKYREVIHNAPDNFDKTEVEGNINLWIVSKMEVASRNTLVYIKTHKPEEPPVKTGVSCGGGGSTKKEPAKLSFLYGNNTKNPYLTFPVWFEAWRR